MKKTILFLLVFVSIWYGGEQKAQVSNYSFLQSFVTYGAANTGTLVGSIQQDDNVTPVALPFNFTYNGTTYSNVNVCSNGYLSFGNLSGFEYTAISDLSTTEVIAPFAQDLFMGTVVSGDISAGSNTIVNVTSVTGLSVGDSLNNMLGQFPGTPIITAINGSSIVVNVNALNNQLAYDMIVMNGTIKQNVSGTAPNRICEFEFKNMTRFAVYNEVINFKVKLYETSNDIEFVYGLMVADVTGIPSEVGLKGSNNTDFNTRRVYSANTWSTSIAASLINQDCAFSSIKYPTNGLSYLWSPTTCATPTLSISQLTPPICAGETITLTAAGANSYSWSTGATVAQITDSPTVTTTYTLYGFNGSCGNSLSITQWVTPAPSLTVVQSNSFICTGQSSTISASGASSYTWSNGNTSPEITISPTITTSYTVQASNGSCTTNSTLTQHVGQTPAISLTQSKSTICKGQTATLTANGASSYTWSTGSNSASITVSPSVTTTYTLKAGANVCTATKFVTQGVSNCTDLDENSARENKFIAYPNPFTNNLSILAEGEKEVTFVLLDALGKEVYSGTLNGEEKQTLDTSSLPAGLYFVTFKNENISQTKKIIKH